MQSQDLLPSDMATLAPTGSGSGHTPVADPTYDEATILNGTFHTVTEREAVGAIMDLVRHGVRGWVSTVNVAILMMMRADPFLQEYVENSALTVADGQPLVWASRLGHSRLPERVTGIDLIEMVCDQAVQEDLTIYLLGATGEVINAAADSLRERHPGVRLVCADGYFTQEEEAQRAEHIAQSGAAILFVGMGVPRQERFIARNWDRLGVTVAMGVGGSFDVIAGLRRRAPLWMQSTGLEWAYRLVQEPRRLFWRYASTNSKFVTLLALSRLQGAETARHRR